MYLCMYAYRNISNVYKISCHLFYCINIFVIICRIGMLVFKVKRKKKLIPFESFSIYMPFFLLIQEPGGYGVVALLSQYISPYNTEVGNNQKIWIEYEKETGKHEILYPLYRQTQ